MEDIKKQPIPDILTLVDKEKFRRQMIWISKLVAIGLVLALVWFGWVNYSYAKDINKILAEKGSLGFCYMCGLETYKKCNCQYYADSYVNKPNYTQIGLDTATWNLEICKDIDTNPMFNPIPNLTVKE